MANRIPYLDYCKALAIFLVVWGHVIFVYDPNRTQNTVWLFIYSFHCPFFMFLSGLFLSRNFERKFSDVLSAKSVSLLVPYLVWSIVCLFYITIPQTNNGNYLEGLKDFLTGGFLHYYWYTKLLFIYIVVTVAIIKIFKNKTIGCLISLVLFTALPDFSLSSVMIVFFVAGHFGWPILKIMDKWYYVIVFFLLWIAMYCFWTPECNYNSKASLTLHIYIVRTLIGVFSSITIILLFKLLSKFISERIGGVISAIGLRTLGIYCSAELFYRGYASLLLNALNICGNLSYLLLGLIVLFISTAFVYVLEKNKYTAFFFLGKKIRNNM